MSRDNARGEAFSGADFGGSARNSRDNARNEVDFGSASRDNSSGEAFSGADFGGSAKKPRDNARNEVDFGSASRDNARGEAFSGADFGEVAKPAEKSAPKPKVIRKNAAAISAYGKISGAPVTTAPPDMDLRAAKMPAEKPADEPVSRALDYQSSEQPHFSQDFPDDEPYKDIGSIFDVLEQSENGMSDKPRRPVYTENEPSPEWEKPAREETPTEVTKENAPSGIWTEDRNLFGSDTQSELDMLKEKKHAKSNKTRRLYDVIMREPDDNPNFRRKN